MAYVRVFNHYVHTPYIVLSVLEACLLVVSLYFGITLRLPDSFIELTRFSDPFYLKAVVYTGVLLSCTLAIGVYQSRFREGLTGVAIRTVVAYCLLGASALTIIYYIVPDLYIGRGVLSISIAIAVGVVIFSRWAFFALVDIERLQRRVLILGAGDKAKETYDLLDKDIETAGFKIVGCFAQEGAKVSVQDSLVLKQTGSLLKSVRALKIDEIVVALDERRRSEGGGFPLDQLLDCKLSGVKVTNSIEFHERETGKIELSFLYPSWMVFSSGFQYSQTRDILKRIFDLLICSILLFFAFPFMLLTALMVFLDDGAPVLFKQTRVGLNGKEFTLYKFRSMRKDAEKDGAQWAKKNDSRVTRVGNFIRNTRLDELPQIYNVIKGDMSFVGPRPERPEFVGDLSQQIPYFGERHRVKPGLMGWAQLKYPYGASVEDAAQKLRYDLYYTKNYSIILDVLIVIQTVEVVLLGKGVR
ncbi:MAG: TIGR03013 family PEP-CTERM/XrtA system glycosyltransferase [Pseudomonadales bacterium]|nr:TIGR03013 family PEP-CTERM/XrtA system glycosyltransferase [Pseudomonadales bacterium]